jgi:hypothetical protein
MDMYSGFWLNAKYRKMRYAAAYASRASTFGGVEHAAEWAAYPQEYGQGRIQWAPHCLHAD